MNNMKLVSFIHFFYEKNKPNVWKLWNINENFIDTHGGCKMLTNSVASLADCWLSQHLQHFRFPESFRKLRPAPTRPFPHSSFQFTRCAPKREKVLTTLKTNQQNTQKK